MLGHLTNLRARIASFDLIEQIRAMNRQSRRDESNLRGLNARLELAAWTDQLTGLGNRLALQRQLGVVRGRIERFGDRYAMLMFDLDHFKRVNDRLGHFAGDDVLRRAAAAVDAATRASDATYRIGGEEFISIVAIDGLAEVGLVAERLRGAVERLEIPHADNPPFGRVTISVGAHLLDASSLAQTVDAWLQRADAAMYTAKKRGRNCVVVG
jgi:diguanylate cyclase (GGDEF)-like protein